jgi:HNH endonuclease
MQDVYERFASKVLCRDGHWIWTGAHRGKGDPYGTFWFEGGLHQAHRVSFLLFVGPIEEGLVVHHTCEIALCVRPMCLEKTTQAANVAHQARNKKTHCKNGHDLSIRGRYRRGGCKACDTDRYYGRL